MPLPAAGSAPPWRCTTSPSCADKKRALAMFNRFRGDRVRYVIDEEYDSPCTIPSYLRDPDRIDFRVKKVCSRQIWKSASGARTSTLRNFTVSFRDSCRRKVIAQMNTDWNGCNEKYSSLIDPSLDPVTQITLPTITHEIELQKKFNATFKGGECPPEAPIHLRQHNPHYNPEREVFYQNFVPAFEQWWMPQQNPKPFTWGAGNIYIGYSYEGDWYDGMMACESGGTPTRLLTYTTINITRYKDGNQTVEQPMWSGRFFLNATILDNCDRYFTDSVEFKLAS